MLTISGPRLHVFPIEMNAHSLLLHWAGTEGTHHVSVSPKTPTEQRTFLGDSVPSIYLVGVVAAWGHSRHVSPLHIVESIWREFLGWMKGAVIGKG